MSSRVLGNQKQGKLFVISAPAGTGKSTLVAMLLKEFPKAIAESCSSTTRKMRPGEVPGQHYDFITDEAFEKLRKKDIFLEHAEVFGTLYGTKQTEVERLEAEGKHVVLVIDTQGALQVMEKMEEATFIFISPPSKEELERRLRERGTESEEKMAQRLKWAEREMGMIDHYDYHIVNDDLDITYQILRSIFIAEEHKRCH